MARNRSHAIVAWLCVGAVALIAYGSLYPFNLKSNANVAGFWSMFGELSWARAGRGDRVSNVLLYAPFGFCLSLWLTSNLRNRKAILVAVFCGAILSLSIELMQVFISSRVPSLWDVTLNTLGALVGAVGGVAWHAMSARLPSALAGGGQPDRVALWVLILWIAAQWAPFLPHFSLFKLKSALQPLIEPRIETWATLHWLVWWLVVAQIVFVLAGGARGMEMLLVAIACVLVGRLFVVDQFFLPSELIALLALLPVMVLLHRVRPASQRFILMAAFAIVFVVDRIWPVHWSGGSFEFWPFLAWIDAGMPLEIAAFLKTLFEFAALTWLLTETGFAMRSAAVAIPILVLALEIFGALFAGRAASITDPILALTLCQMLRFIEARPRSGFTPQRVRSR